MKDMMLEQGPQGTAQENGPAIFDVTTEQFEKDVMLASMKVPVIVDFWAPWCGPCKQLMPVLEQAVHMTGGKVRLAKVNIDENPELAQALRIQSVPAVFAFIDGQPVDAFMGLKSPAEIKLFIDKIVQAARAGEEDALDIPAALDGAAQALADGEIGAAQAIYSQVLEQDPFNAAAYAGIVRSFIAGGDLAEARALLGDIPPEIAQDTQIAAAQTALEMAENAPDAGAVDALTAQIEANPKDHQARFDLAQACFAMGRREEAVDHLIEIIRRDRKWKDEQARLELLKIFEAMGPSAPETMDGRRKLSSVLFS